MSKDFVLEMNNITKTFPGVKALDNVTFKVRPGTVHALMGENGAGKSTLMKCLFGIYEENSGDIILYGEKVKIHNSKEALDLGISMIHQELHPIRFRPVMENIWLGRFPMRGIAIDHKRMAEKTKELFKNVRSAKQENIALMTEERRATGIFPILSVLDNAVIASQKNYTHGGVISDKKRREAAKRVNDQLRTKTPSLQTEMQDLSGGNQQKVLLARWLLTNPDILILDEPTRGIDVGAKYEIYTIMHDLVSNGKSIIMISSEMPELLGMSDRVMVMCEGRQTAILGREEADSISIMQYATQFM